LENLKSSNRKIDSSTLLAMFRQTHDAILKIRQKELRAFDITPEQMGALAAIRAIGPVATAAQLSKWLFRNPDSMTVLLRRLEKKGLIEKTPDTRRKNIMRLKLTKTGEKAFHSASGADQANTILDKLPARKKAQLWAILDKLRSRALETLEMDKADYSGFFEKFKDKE
jgi:DNA-binding MarR family transcriptional regulator